MYINPYELEHLLNVAEEAKMSPYDLARFRGKIDKALRAEKDKEAKRREAHLKFCDRIYNILCDSVIPVSATDIQFIIFANTHEQFSCSKISSALRHMVYWEEYQSNYPDITREHRKGRSLFYIKK